MASGQIDPARLSGEALHRWFSRTSAEIEQERRLAADARYHQFFGRGAAAEPSEPEKQARAQNTEGNKSPYLIQVADPQGLSDYWSAPSCRNCHGFKPWPLPPFDRPTLFPPNVDPRQGARGRPSREPDACEQQKEQDERICDKQPTSQYQAICHASKMQRYATCLRTRKLETPPLDTFRRLNPR